MLAHRWCTDIHAYKTAIYNTDIIDIIKFIRFCCQFNIKLDIRGKGEFQLKSSFHQVGLQACLWSSLFIGDQCVRTWAIAGSAISCQVGQGSQRKMVEHEPEGKPINIFTLSKH